MEAERIRVEGGVLTELYQRYGLEAIRFAYLLTGDRTVAEDLVQDAFVRLAGRFLHLRDPGGLHAYLRTTLVNLSRSHFRHEAVIRKFVDNQPRHVPSVPGPDGAERDVLRRALMQLPLRQRTAIVLRHYEDLSEEQTAAVMRCAVTSVHSLVTRGMATLRKVMDDEQRV
jgi:RNA polymerase sigma-70 factor (sigma-E family)